MARRHRMTTTNRRYGRAMAGAFLLAWAIGAPLFARPGVVKTSDGRTIDGEVIEQPDAVTVTSRGIDTVIPRAQVATITYGGNAEDEFHAKLTQLDPKDVPGRMKIAHDAFDARKYEVA